MAGAFICQVSDTDWQISRIKGVYGNRKNKPDSREPLRRQDQLSVIRDLIAVRPGDLIFFHVIGGGSGIHGPYTPRTDPYYDDSIIWDNSKETFPYRFMFKPFPGYELLCETDMAIGVSNLYQAIEAREVWSIATLENERNIEKRAVRKISLSDAQIVLNIFLREFKTNVGKALPINLTPVPSTLKHMRTQIDNVGRYENAVKALFMDKLADKHPSLVSIFPHCIDHVNETFVAPTTRKLIDILVVSSKNNGINHYYIVEAKNEKFGFEELRQLMWYMDLFRQRLIFRPAIDNISACALATVFDSDTVQFRNLHNTFSPYDPIILIQYKPTDQARDALFNIFAGTSSINMSAINITTTSPLPWGNLSPKDDIITNVSNDLPCYDSNKYLVRSLTSQPNSNSFVIEEKNKLLNNTISICYIFVWDKVFSSYAFLKFIETFYKNIAPLTSYNFRAIKPVIVSRGYEPDTLNYITRYNALSIRRPISVFQW